MHSLFLMMFKKQSICMAEDAGLATATGALPVFKRSAIQMPISLLVSCLWKV